MTQFPKNPANQNGLFRLDAPNLYVKNDARFRVIGFMFEHHAAQSEAEMRNVIFAINITLDGSCDHTKMIADEEIHEYFTHVMRDVDLLVFGRKTYQLMVPFWPDIAKNHSETKAENEFADTFDSINKIVFSQSFDSAEGNTRVVRTKLQDEILKLKQEQGKNILIGGVAIPSQLTELGLVDEYHFVVHPIVAGEGRRLLEGISLPEKLQLKLVESKIFKSGCVALHYMKQWQNKLPETRAALCQSSLFPLCTVLSDRAW